MLKRYARWAAVAGLLLLSSAAFAWRDTGHQAVALIALQRLEPAQRARLEAILKGDPEMGDLLDAAVWPDRHRRRPDRHYVNFILGASKRRGEPPVGENVITAIEELKQIVRDRRGSAIEQAEALAELIHFVGDIHQPLHTTARVCPAAPNGDRGGNDFLLRGKYRNLHSLWDNAFALVSPLTTPQDLAADLMRQHPDSRLRKQLAVTDPRRWAIEGYEICRRQVYRLDDKGPEPTLPPAKYERAAERTARTRLALAGYRLGDLLNEVLR